MDFNKINYCEYKGIFKETLKGLRRKGYIGLNIFLSDINDEQWEQYKEKTVLIIHEETKTVELMSEDDLRELHKAPRAPKRAEDVTGTDKLIELVEEWSVDRELNVAEPSKQFLKVTEEVGELSAALARNNREDFIDALGDTLVTLIILSQQTNTDITEALRVAYKEIKDRTGEMQDGVFIKSEDL